VSLPGLTPDQVLSTTRQVRKRLDLDRPVERQVVEECLRLAFQAPNGANSQDWGWVLVDDAVARAAMAEIYRAGLQDHQARDATGEIADPASPEARARSRSATAQLAANMHRVPVLLVSVIGRRYGHDTTFQEASKWGSILPATWSLMLALRSRGLGSAWTTLHLYREREMAELLGIPYPEYTQAGLFPIAYTIGTDFKPADRALSDRRIFWNGWSRP
jgi:nitroreductase